jgi:hypothetical protein
MITSLIIRYPGRQHVLQCRRCLSMPNRRHAKTAERNEYGRGAGRERLSAAATFRSQAAWWIEEMVDGRIVHAKKREPIDPNTINSYRNAVAYLNELIGDLPLASIDNRLARTVIAQMKSERRKDGERRFSEKTIWSTSGCSAGSSLRCLTRISIPSISEVGTLRPSACHASIPGSNGVLPSHRRR